MLAGLGRNLVKGSMSIEKTINTSFGDEIRHNACKIVNE